MRPEAKPRRRSSGRKKFPTCVCLSSHPACKKIWKIGKPNLGSCEQKRQRLGARQALAMKPAAIALALGELIFQVRSRFDRFDFDTVRYFGLDIASIFRAPNQCWTRCLHLATCLRERFGFDRFDCVSVSISSPFWRLKPALLTDKLVCAWGDR